MYETFISSTEEYKDEFGNINDRVSRQGYLSCFCQNEQKNGVPGD